MYFSTKFWDVTTELEHGNIVCLQLSWQLVRDPCLGGRCVLLPACDASQECVTVHVATAVHAMRIGACFLFYGHMLLLSWLGGTP